MQAQAQLTEWLQQIAKMQIHTSEQIGQLTVRMDRLTERMEKHVEVQAHTDERLNALIAVVDDVVRHRPLQ